MSTDGNANIPQPSAPFLVGRQEPISPIWWAFLLALFQRSGGSIPTPPVTQIDFAPLIDAQAPLPLFKPDPDGFSPLPVPFVFQDMPPDAVPVPTFTSDPIEDIFTAPGGFTPGTTTTLTLSKVYASKAAVMVHFDGAFQGTDQYSISGNTITFTSPIPVGVSNVYARG